MDSTNRTEFKEIMDGLAEYYQKPKMTKVMLQIFFGALDRYSMEQVRSAMTEHIKNPDGGQFMPKAADVIKHINGFQALDGRVEANEAWNIALQSSDERDTVVWTDEIAIAMTACSEILMQGDKVGARMAFIEAYRKACDAARGEGKPVHWYASLGSDSRMREGAIAKAVELGRLSASKYQNLLEHSNQPEASMQNLLTNTEKAAVGSEAAREALDELRGILESDEPEVDRKGLVSD